MSLTQDQEALIDSADAGLIGRHDWYAARRRGRYYVATAIAGRTVYMHRLLAGTDGLDVDHVNHNGLDNRRENLRVATKSQNQHNQGISRNNTSGFKGVRWDARAQKWRARIQHTGRQRHLGLFATPELAHAAYCAAARELHGEFACFGAKK